MNVVSKSACKLSGNLPHAQTEGLSFWGGYITCFARSTNRG